MTETIQNIHSKSFIIKRSELTERYDPYFYKGEFKILRDLLSDKNFGKVGDIILSWNRGDGPRDGFYTDDIENGVYFLRVNNLKNNSIDLTDVKYINRSIHNTKLKRTQVKGGDLIFAISGTKDNLGTVSIIPEKIKEANLNSALVRLDLDLQKITKEFFCLLFDLKFIRTQIEFIGKGAAQNNLNNAEIKSIQIPKLQIDKQREIVDNFKKSLSQKQQKDEQAHKLLKNIDEYLLRELGITLKQRKYTSEERMFLSSYREIVGLRLDPLYFKNAGNIESDKYENVPLRRITNISKGQSITKEKITKGNYPVIAGGQSSPYNHGLYNFSGNIITISASGAYSGYVWYHNYPIFASDCNVLQSKDETKVNTEFVYFVLKALQTEIYKLQQGAGQPHVYSRDIEKFTIPVPPISKQTEILKHIKQIQEQITKLKTEATYILDNAKAEVEKIILGN